MIIILNILLVAVLLITAYFAIYFKNRLTSYKKAGYFETEYPPFFDSQGESVTTGHIINIDDVDHSYLALVRWNFDNGRYEFISLEDWRNADQRNTQPFNDHKFQIVACTDCMSPEEEPIGDYLVCPHCKRIVE